MILIGVELDTIVLNEIEEDDVECNSLRCYHDAELVHQYYSSSIRSFRTFLPQQQLAISRIRCYMTKIIMIEQTYIYFTSYLQLDGNFSLTEVYSEWAVIICIK